MAPHLETNAYALGSEDFEQERLQRQAVWVAPHSEHLFRRAGIGPGQRVLELGSGVGDVALIVGRLVGASGEVVGVEREPRSIARASARMKELGLGQVRFVQADLMELPQDRPFDAGVGRYILMYLKDPVAILREVSRRVRPGGAIAFLDTTFRSFLDQCQGLPLWQEAAQLMTEIFRRTGANTEMGRELSAVFVGAELPEPETETYTLTGTERWMSDCLISLRPQAEALGMPMERLGDLGTLQQRLMDELAARGRSVPLPQMVGAWSRVLAGR
jgi:ubiquinone/menaquinone biosynthesis C-methylase UbiE